MRATTNPHRAHAKPKKPICRNVCVAWSVKTKAEADELVERVSGHSMRAGYATSAAANDSNGVPCAGANLVRSACGSKQVLTYPESNRDARKGPER
jgi:hypothetical protein